MPISIRPIQPADAETITALFDAIDRPANRLPDCRICQLSFL
jgi:hypothetical protein